MTRGSGTRFSRFRLVILAAVLASAASGLAGCGTAAAPKPGPKVTLSLTGPANESRTSAAAIAVAGRVSPHRARVLVLGQRVKVARDGSFSARIGLTVGPNLIDVEASLPRSSGASTAVDVVRFQLVTVPDVVGDSPAQATSTLKGLGLIVSTQGSSDPFNFLIPGTTEVCTVTPGAGTKVDPGSTVTIKSSKLCF